MKVYLAGPMRGIPEFNFPAFHAAAAKLRAEGHEVFSPAEADIERMKHDFSKHYPTGDEAQLAEDRGFSIRQALAEDLLWICQHADAIALLPGWSYSAGASAELALAKALKLPAIVLAEPTDLSADGFHELCHLKYQNFRVTVL